MSGGGGRGGGAASGGRDRGGAGGRGAAAGALVVIGDALLDRDVDGTVTRLAPDAPVPVLDQRRATERPGGAALAAALAAADGRPVTLVTALADDAAGRLLAELLAAAGVELVDLGLAGTTPEKIRLRADARPLLRLDRGAGGAVGAVGAAARAAIGWADAVLVSDYGRGVAAAAGVRAALADRIAAGLPVVWDPHPRGPAPVAGIALATPNAAEAATFAAGDGAYRGANDANRGANDANTGANAAHRGANDANTGANAAHRGANDANRGAAVTGADPLVTAALHASTLRRRWAAGAVCVTRGARGALLDDGSDAPLALPAPPIASGGDPCGAGDRFAATAAGCLADGGDAFAAIQAAVAAASQFVGAGGAGAIGVSGTAAGNVDAGPAGGLTAAKPPAVSAADPADPFALAAAVRAQGGTVVATGGCFDLLHAGHVQTLQAARGLGDCLIVCLNADASVRALKGPGRPVVGERERAALLRALACVDGVAIFAEPTPVALLERLRPDVWVKGGDYDGRTLPEAAALDRWGGRVVLVPHRAGLSTTHLIEEAANHVARR